MSSQIDLDPVGRITAAAVGDPGQRVFYLQARKEDVLVSLVLEKQQVALLTMHIDELLERVGQPDEASEVEALDLEEPIVPEFRVGRIGLGYDDERQLVMLQCEEFVPEEDEEAVTAEPPEPSRVRLWATKEQMYAVARRGEKEVAAGRPLCPMCGEAVDPEGHFCPRSNGHREVSQLT